MRVSIALKAEETNEVDMSPAAVVCLLAQAMQPAARTVAAWEGLEPARRKGGLVHGGPLTIDGSQVGEFCLEIDE